jgi:hypothetical protein
MNESNGEIEQSICVGCLIEQFLLRFKSFDILYKSQLSWD